MEKNKRLIIICILAAVILLALLHNLSSFKLWTVVKLDEEGATQQEMVSFKGQDTDIRTYVNNIWDSEIIPYMEEKANEITAVINMIEKNGEDEAGEKYGIREYEVGTPW